MPCGAGRLVPRGLAVHTNAPPAPTHCTHTAKGGWCWQCETTAALHVARCWRAQRCGPASDGAGSERHVRDPSSPMFCVRPFCHVSCRYVFGVVSDARCVLACRCLKTLRMLRKRMKLWATMGSQGDVRHACSRLPPLRRVRRHAPQLHRPAPGRPRHADRPPIRTRAPRAPVRHGAPRVDGVQPGRRHGVCSSPAGTPP